MRPTDALSADTGSARRASAADGPYLPPLLDTLPGVAYRCDLTPPYTVWYVSQRIEALTGHPREAWLSGAIGWIDVIHPEDRGRVVAEVAAAVAAGEEFDLLYRLVRPDGELRWLSEQGRAVYEDGTPICLDGFVFDVTERRRAEEALRQAGEQDPLTGLANRRAFQLHLQAAVLGAMSSDRNVGLILLDLDHFKHVNDTLGHSTGDDLLRAIGARIRDALGPREFVARLGGDEFAILVEGVEHPCALAGLAHRLLLLTSHPVAAGRASTTIGASIGGALFPRDADSADELLKSADMALHAVKGAGRGGVQIFDSAIRARAQRSASQLNVAREILSRETIVPYYQPKVALRDGALSGFEALLRWRGPSGPLHGPAAVWEAFNDYELASKIGSVMQTHVFADLAQWRARGLCPGIVSINAAPAEFLRDDYAESLLARLEAVNVEPATIEVEVTEQVFFERGHDLVRRALRRLHRAGVRIALDDFGTGCSSLTHLRDFPVDVLKIDRSFVCKMNSQRDINSIVAAVVDLARRLSIEVVAEGVEHDCQVEQLKTMGCGFAQGFLFGQPQPAVAVAKRLEQSKR